MTHVTPAMIANERMNRNWSQKRLAKDASVSPKTISRLEDEETVRPDTWVQVLSALGFSTTRRTHHALPLSLDEDRTEEAVASYPSSRLPLNADDRFLLRIAILIAVVAFTVPTCVWLFSSAPHDFPVLYMSSVSVGMLVLLFFLQPFTTDTVIHVVTARELSADLLNRVAHAVREVVGDTVHIGTVSTFNGTHSIRITARLPKADHASALYGLRGMGLKATVASRH